MPSKLFQNTLKHPDKLLYIYIFIYLFYNLNRMRGKRNSLKEKGKVKAHHTFKAATYCCYDKVALKSHPIKNPTNTEPLFRNHNYIVHISRSRTWGCTKSIMQKCMTSSCTYLVTIIEEINVARRTKGSNVNYLACNNCLFSFYIHM